MQSIFINKALHSKSTETSYCHHTVHVASIARFLSFLNLGMWIMKTVDVEGLDHKIYLNGTYEELIISNTKGTTPTGCFCFFSVSLLLFSTQSIQPSLSTECLVLTTGLKILYPWKILAGNWKSLINNVRS